MSYHYHQDPEDFDPDGCNACYEEYRRTIDQRLRDISGPKNKSKMEILIEASTIQRYAADDGYSLSNADAEAYAKEFWL